MAASIGFNAQNQFTVGGTALDYGRNFIINGGFDYWNYATSQTTSGYGSDDRWSNSNTGSTKTHSLVASTDTERALFNSSKFSRTVVASVVGVANFAHKFQKIENVTKLAGKTVTISFWAKADVAKNIAIDLFQNFGTGGAPSASISSIGAQIIALTTTWQKKTLTIAIPAIVGKTLGTDGVHTSFTGLAFWFDAGSDYNARTASLGQQSGTFDIAEVKLEEGSVATPWTPYEGEFGGEVQACMRYYEKGQITHVCAAAHNYATIPFCFKAEKRVAPTTTCASPITSTNNTLRGDAADYAATITANTYAGRVTASNVSIGVNVFITANITASSEL